MAFDRTQKYVLENYDGGEHAHIESKRELQECGDGLLRFLMAELSHREDCDTQEDAVRRIDAAIRQLEDLRDRFMDFDDQSEEDEADIEMAG